VQEVSSLTWGDPGPAATGGSWSARSYALPGKCGSRRPAFASASGQRDWPVLVWRCADQVAGWPAGYSGSALAGSLGRAWSSWPREPMANLAKTLPRWYWTVRALMNSRLPISGFERPSRASRAIRAS
jgi:hypothetical protein